MEQFEIGEEFAGFIARDWAGDDILDSRLLIAREGDLETYYAPFEHLNANARVTIIGLTPGQTQARIALTEARLGLTRGLDWKDAIERAKYLASFGGSLRRNLTRMLDYVGLQKWLRIESCDLLFSDRRALAHHTSVLRYPVFNNRRNYSGQPLIDRSAFLEKQVNRWFATELSSLPNSIFVPLGAQVQTVFARIAKEKGILEDRCLVGIPHPSGANAERIAYFLNGKTKASLSRQTSSEAIDLAREQLIAKIRNLREQPFSRL